MPLPILLPILGALLGGGSLAGGMMSRKSEATGEDAGLLGRLFPDQGVQARQAEREQQQLMGVRAAFDAQQQRDQIASQSAVANTPGLMGLTQRQQTPIIEQYERMSEATRGLGMQTNVDKLKEIYSVEKDLNRRYRDELAGFAGVQGAIRDVMQLSKGTSALQTEASIIKLAKALDPASVVRGGETAVIKATQSIPQQLATAMNQLLKGGAGDPSLLRAIQATAADLYKTSVIPAQAQLEQFKELSRMYPGVRPEAIATGLGIDWKYSPQMGGIPAPGPANAGGGRR